MCRSSHPRGFGGERSGSARGDVDGRERERDAEGVGFTYRDFGWRPNTGRKTFGSPIRTV